MLTQSPLTSSSSLIRDWVLSPSLVHIPGERRFIQNYRNLFCIAQDKHQLNRVYIDKFKINRQCENEVEWLRLYETQTNDILPLIFSTNKSDCDKSLSTVVDKRESDHCTLYLFNQMSTVIVAICIDNDNVVKCICDLSNAFHNIVEGETVTVLDVVDYKNKCWIFVQDDTDLTVSIFSHNIDTNMFSKLKHWNSMENIAHSNLISNGAALFNVEHYDIHKWNIQQIDIEEDKLKIHTQEEEIDLRYLRFDSPIMLKGFRYCLLFESQHLYLLDRNTLRIIEIDAVDVNCIDAVGECYAILNRNYDLVTVSGFIRDLNSKNEISNSIIPPEYLMQMISNYYCNEMIYVLRETSVTEIDVLWIIKVDQLLTNYIY